MKRIYLVVVLALISCMNSKAQDIKWQLGGTVGYDNFKNDGSVNSIVYREDFDPIKTRANQWRFEFNIERTLPNKRLFLNLGIGFGQLNVVAKNINISLPLY